MISSSGYTRSTTKKSSALSLPPPLPTTSSSASPNQACRRSRSPLLLGRSPATSAPPPTLTGNCIASLLEFYQPTLLEAFVESRILTSPVTLEEGELLHRDALTTYACSYRSLHSIEKTCAEKTCVLPSMNLEDKDIVSWSNTSNGKYAVAQAYKGQFNEAPIWNWQLIWKLRVQAKVKSFLWTLLHKKILTNVQRFARCITDDKRCIHCNVDETIAHIFCDCVLARELWDHCNLLGFPVKNNINNLDKWLEENLCCLLTKNNRLQWRITFAYALWHIWKWRCNSIFQINYPRPTCLLQMINKDVVQWAATYTLEQVAPRIQQDLLWRMPNQGFVKLNCDGSCNKFGYIKAGGLIRDFNGS